MNKFRIVISLFVLIIGFINPLSAQSLEGRIVDQNENPILGSLVLIKETYQGVACNENGEFQINLYPGTYTVDFRSLGYKTQTKKITIQEGEVRTEFLELEENPIVLEEVVVIGKEDPAYEIIRQAIKKAPYHQNIIKEYVAECYIKGNLELTKISKIVDQMVNIDGARPSDFKNQLFVQESFSEIKYQAPDQYDQTVKAFSSTIPDNFNPKHVIPLAISSLYLPRFNIHISPLNPKAFTYYRFQYEGYTEENKEVVNKIKVIPKMNDPELLEGYLYIADESWDIRHADLQSNVLGIKQHVNINYDKLGDIAYMPTTFSNKMQGNVLGTQGYFNYYASIKYLDFTKNDSIDYDQKRSIVITPQNLKKSLEIKVDDFYRISSDSLATRRDSLFWKDIRNTPLSLREEHSYETRDSIQHHFDQVRDNPKNANFKPIDLIFGGRIGGDSTFVTFTHGGIPGILRDYNFVDGYGLGYKFSLSKKMKAKNKLTLTPEIYYTTERNSWVWKTDIEYTYSPLRLGKVIFSAGNSTTDYNPVGVNRQDNAMSSYLWGQNKSMFYRNKFAQITNHIDLTHALQLSAQMKWSKRSTLHNNRIFSIFGAERKAKANFENGSYPDLLSYAVRLQYTPKYYYAILGGQKRYIYASYPTFGISYSEGFSSLGESNSRFRKIEGTIEHELKTDLFSTLTYKVNGGTFIGNKNRMNFADYKHFNASGDYILIAKSPLNSLMLIDPYIASTNRYWLYSHINYRSKYILLTRIPFLQGKFLNEAVHLKYLFTPNRRNYIEVGYTIDIFKALSVGAHWGFNNFQSDNFNAKVTIDFNFFKSFK